MFLETIYKLRVIKIQLKESNVGGGSKMAEE